MGVYCGPKSTLVTNSMVDAVITTGITTTTNADINGSYIYQGTINLGGCGNPNSAVFIRLKDSIPWKKITCFFVSKHSENSDIKREYQSFFTDFRKRNQEIIK